MQKQAHTILHHPKYGRLVNDPHTPFRARMTFIVKKNSFNRFMTSFHSFLCQTPIFPFDLALEDFRIQVFSGANARIELVLFFAICNGTMSLPMFLEKHHRDSNVVKSIDRLMLIINMFQFGIFMGYTLRNSKQSNFFAHDQIMICIKKVYNLFHKTGPCKAGNNAQSKVSPKGGKVSNQLRNEPVVLFDLTIKRLPCLDDLMCFLIPRHKHFCSQRSLLVYSFDSVNYANHFESAFIFQITFRLGVQIGQEKTQNQVQFFEENAGFCVG